MSCNLLYYNGLKIEAPVAQLDRASVYGADNRLYKPRTNKDLTAFLSRYRHNRRTAVGQMYIKRTLLARTLARAQHLTLARPVYKLSKQQTKPWAITQITWSN